MAGRAAEDSGSRAKTSCEDERRETDDTAGSRLGKFEDDETPRVVSGARFPTPDGGGGLMAGAAARDVRN